MISVVIVNYNTCSILQDCLRHLNKIDKRLEIIVVDNASTDGSVEMVKKEFHRVELVASKTNLGLAAGNNSGLKIAKGAYVLFMGSDAFPQDDCLELLVKYLDDDKDVGVVVGKVVLRDGSLDRDTHRGLPTPWVAFTHLSGLGRLFPKSKLFGGYFLEYKDFEAIHDIELCTTHFMMVRKEVFKKVGKWDEQFFVYGEDVDFCYRVKKAGWRIVYVPEAHVLHYKGVSVGVRKETADITKASSETKIKMLKESTEAMKKFYKKHYSRSIFAGLVIFAIEMLAKYRERRTSTIA